LPSLFEARRRLPTSATALRRAGNQTRTLQSSQGRRPRPPSFSSAPHAASLARAVKRGEPRYVRLREPQCWFLPVTRVCPTVMPSRTPHLRGFRLRSIVRIDVHGSKDRAKDASPHRLRRFLVPARGAYALKRVCGRRSPPRRPSDIRCHRRDLRCGGTAEKEPDRPRPPFRRRPAKSIAFQTTRMPFTVTTREGLLSQSRREGSLRPSRRLSRSRRPHVVCPEGRTVFLDGHCKVTVRSPASSVTISRVRTPLLPDACAWS
jgi:hypothetical protein